jgi:hypothetical protein
MSANRIGQAIVGVDQGCFYFVGYFRVVQTMTMYHMKNWKIGALYFDYRFCFEVHFLCRIVLA